MFATNDAQLDGLPGTIVKNLDGTINYETRTRANAGGGTITYTRTWTYPDGQTATFSAWVQS
jgi:hypothetical protein